MTSCQPRALRVSPPLPGPGGQLAPGWLVCGRGCCLVPATAAPTASALRLRHIVAALALRGHAVTGAVRLDGVLGRAGLVLLVREGEVLEDLDASAA